MQYLHTNIASAVCMAGIGEGQSMKVRAASYPRERLLQRLPGP